MKWLIEKKMRLQTATFWQHVIYKKYLMMLFEQRKAAVLEWRIAVCHTGLRGSRENGHAPGSWYASIHLHWEIKCIIPHLFCGNLEQRGRVPKWDKNIIGKETTKKKKKNPSWKSIFKISAKCIQPCIKSIIH